MTQPCPGNSMTPMHPW